LGGAADFDGTLVSVLQNRPADCEIIVVHTEEYDDPYDLRSEVRFVAADRGQSIVELINEGLASAAGDVVHILGCRITATESWTEPALERFDDPEVAAVSPLILDASGAKLVAAGVRWSLGGTRKVVANQRLLLPGTARLRASILGPTLAAGFYRRSVLEALAGFDAALGDRHADVDLALKLRDLDLRTVCESASRVIQTESYTPLNDRSFQSGRAAERLFWLNAGSRGLFPSLLMHPLAVAGDIASRLKTSGAIGALTGRLVAALEIGTLRRHEERLALALQRLAEADDEPATIPMSAARQSPQASHRRRAAA
jgi:hypothetical protein